MKKLTATILTVLCFSASANKTDSVSTNSFSCIDSKSFEINATCMSNKIETNDSFMTSQAMLSKKTENASSNAMASITMDPKTLEIQVIAHKDAYLAKLGKE